MLLEIFKLNISKSWKKSLFCVYGEIYFLLAKGGPVTSRGVQKGALGKRIDWRHGLFLPGLRHNFCCWLLLWVCEFFSWPRRVLRLLALLLSLSLLSFCSFLSLSPRSLWKINAQKQGEIYCYFHVRFRRYFLLLFFCLKDCGVIFTLSLEFKRTDPLLTSSRRFN